MARDPRLTNVARTERRGVLWVGYVLATVFAFPHYVAGRVVDLGLVLAWVGPVCLVLAIEGLGPRAAAKRAFLASLVAHTAILHWIYIVTVTYGHAPPLAGIVAPAGLGAYIAAFSALFASGAAWLQARSRAGPLTLAAWWSALDHLRSFALSGFPWATLGYAQHGNHRLLELASWTGVYGLSFVSVAGGLALVEIARALHARRWPQAPAVVVVVALVALHALGIPRRRPEDPESAARLRVAVLQGNIDQGVKWSREWSERILTIYEDLSRRAAAAGADVILWPETAVPGALSVDESLRQRLQALARETRTRLLVGGVAIERDGSGLRFYDSAFLFDRDGVQLDRYDKAHLVPFGEYVPLRSLIGRFASAIARGIAADQVHPGSGPRGMNLSPEAGDGNLTVGVPICYELLFPDLVRRFVKAGGGALFALTNDAWYGRTGAPFQFLAITALRAAENRVWVMRAANTGVSAVIDERGRVLQQTGIFEQGFLVADVPLRPPPIGGGFYTRHGDLFAIACWIGVAGVAGFAGFADRRRHA